MQNDPTYRSTRYPCVYWRRGKLRYQYRDEQGEWRHRTYGEGTPRDAMLAQQKAQERADAIRAGLLDPVQARIEDEAAKPIGRPVSDYIGHLRAKGDSEGHVRTCDAYLLRWWAGCGFGTLKDIDAHRTLTWLTETYPGAGSYNKARAAVLGFTRWLFDHGRTARNMLPSGLITKRDPQADRRRPRRVLTLDEFWQLADVVPIERAAFYVVAALTGLRWREVARLRWSDIHLDDGYVVARAGKTKNRRRAELPLRDDVVDILRRWRDKCRGDHVFSAEPRLRTWKADLVRAGIVSVINRKLPYRERFTNANLDGYVDEDGHQLDRGCLRLSYNTWMAEAGVPLDNRQWLMRHSDPRLTACTYRDIRLHHHRAEVGKIPSRHGAQRNGNEDRQNNATA